MTAIAAKSKRNDLIYRMHRSGLTYTKLGELFDLSTARVQQICRRERHRNEGCWGDTYCCYCGRGLL